MRLQLDGAQPVETYKPESTRCEHFASATMPAMGTVLSVTGAHKQFGDTAALQGAELELHSGEWLGLLGPNGAGKTTLVRALAGRVRLDKGELEILGKTLDRTSDDDEVRSRLGIVPQEIALYPQLTALENLSAWGRLNGVAGADLPGRIQWALDWTGLGDRDREPVKQFSGGMRRATCSIIRWL